MTGTPAPIAAVPWDDRVKLSRWVLENRSRVTPAIAERLLIDEGFDEAGPMPTQTSVRCVAWKPKLAEQSPDLAKLTVNLYYTEVLSTANITTVLIAIARLRQWKAAQGVA